MGTSAANEKLTGYKAPAVQRAFRLLRAVSRGDGALSLTELTEVLGFSKSTTHGLVHALLREGALVQDVDRKLYLGPVVVDLAFSSWNYIRMVRSVQPAIDELRNRIGETTVLGALVCNRILIMAAAESTDPLKISASPGTILPLFAGAAGKVLLATKPESAVKSLIREHGLPHHTARSIVGEAAYLKELEKVRQQGYSIDDEEYLMGVAAVALALNNAKGPPMAVWAVGLSSGMAGGKIPHALDAMTAEATHLRRLLEANSGL